MMLKRVLQKNLGVPGTKRKKARESVSSTDKPSAIELCAETSELRRKRKRGEYSSGKNKLKKQQTAEGSNSLVRRVENMDYISHLPESVIHLILSLLRSTKDAARTSILSKRWRDMWTSFSVLTFDQCKFQEMDGVKDMENKNEIFREFIDKSLQSLLECKLGIQKLVLHLNSYDAELAHDMERWIQLATENQTKELGFHVHMKGKKSTYTLPKSVFAAERITGLRLEGCKLEKLESSSTIKLPLLQKLYLRNLHVDEPIIATFVSNCPLIEDLRLIQCAGLKYLLISSLPKLDRLEVHYCHGLKKIEVKAPSLRTFWYCGKKYMSCKIFLNDCDSLKRLTLEDHRMRDDLFLKRFYSFPLLEKLELSKCPHLRNIRIVSHRLNRLVLRGCKNLQEVEIDTPNLHSLEYQGDKMPFSFSNPSCLKEAKLSFKPEGDRKFQLDGEIEPSWAPKLQEFIGKFMNEGFKLVVRANKNVIIHDGIEEQLIAWCDGLKIEIFHSDVSTEEILDSSLQKQHTETLSIMAASGSEFPKLVLEKINNRKEDLTCCSSNNPNNKCWRHFLKTAKIVNLKAVKDKRQTSIMDRLKQRLDVCEITCFRLNWKLDKVTCNYG